MSTQPICFIDIETDGLHHGRQVYEIAVIKRHTDPEVLAARAGLVVPLGPEDVFHAFVHMSGFALSDSYGIRVGGFFDRHPQGRELTGKPPIPGVDVLSRKTAAVRVHQLLHDAHIVGVNPTFDVTTLANFLRAEGVPAEPWDYHLEDLVAETVGYLRGWARRQDKVAEYADLLALPWKSELLAAAVGVDPVPGDQRHTALADARWAQRWHDALADALAGALAAEAAA